MRCARLRRLRGGGDGGGDLNEVFLLREEARALSQLRQHLWLRDCTDARVRVCSYAIGDGQRLLLEDVTWRAERAAKGVHDDNALGADESGMAIGGDAADDASALVGVMHVRLQLSDAVRVRALAALGSADALERVLVSVVVAVRALNGAEHRRRD
jgi:hypothetical protein